MHPLFRDPDPRVPLKLLGKNGFKNFMWVVWKATLNTTPTPVQYDIGDWMQNGPNDQVTMAFRGVGKSWIAAAFVVWALLLNPALNIMVVSASKERADDFSTFCWQIIDACGDLTAHMKPSLDQRTSKQKFDVADAPAAQAASVFSRGIFSQKTGFRADIIMVDDVSTPETSETQNLRDKLERRSREFRSILKPGGGRIMHLGTPQTEQDLLHGLIHKGFKVRIWPSEIPPVRLQQEQGDRLAPMIRRMIEEGVKVGTPTDPMRFGEEELELKRQEGDAYYAMQFLLDHSLSDIDRYPLKIPNLLIADLDPAKTHEVWQWARDPDLRWKGDDVPDCVGFNGDAYYRPLARTGDLVPYSGIVMAVDPSGRGADETAYAVVGQYGGQLFLLDSGGFQGGFEPETLRALAITAGKWKVNKVIVEANYGGGAHTALLQQHLDNPIYGHRCGVEEVTHHTAKEKRICDVLEPIISAHKLVVNRGLLRQDFESVKDYPTEKRQHYMLMHQLSRITRSKGSLRHDDRLEALAMACQYWVDFLRSNAETKRHRRSEALRDKALQRRVKEQRGVRCVMGVPDRRRSTWV